MAQAELFPGMPEPMSEDKRGRKKNDTSGSGKGYEPPNLGKAIRLPVPDFSNPNRPLTCLEVDFPIEPINALSSLEGNAGKPIYQMSKWWARRRSSVFRSLLIAAVVEARDKHDEAAKLVWDHYYANHQKAGTFKKLRVLDPFMGGGTTMVEGARLGLQMTGIDLNPVAWFVTKNELACSDPKLVKALFDQIEQEVKPLVQPFYTTTCPRGHKGRWIDKTKLGSAGELTPQALMPEAFDMLDLPPEQRKPYEWRGPEVIYTFWAKHGPCQASGCSHRTPIFRDPVIAQKNLSRFYIETRCPSCGHEFNIELGETRMAPGCERVVLENEPAFTETSQVFANLLKDYDRGNVADTAVRMKQLLAMLKEEPGLRCPECGKFGGQVIQAVLEKHSKARRAADVKKAHFGIQRGSVQMHLLIHPDWLKGAQADDESGKEYGGYAGAPAEETIEWYGKRLEGLAVVEVRSQKLPEQLNLPDGAVIRTGDGTVPGKSKFTCQSCGLQADILESVKPTEHTAPVAPYTLQCHCPECDAEGYNYNGRYFKAPDSYDIERLARAEREWARRCEADLKDCWPREDIPFSMAAHVEHPLPGHGYTHWWKMFNARQLLVHTHLLRAIALKRAEDWPLDIREQALGAFQQYLRNQNMFCLWDLGYDKLVPMMSNANYNPRVQTVENCVFPVLGRGNWETVSSTVVEGLTWARDSWEVCIPLESHQSRSLRVKPGDPVAGGPWTIYCGSSTDLSCVRGGFDLVITDPPFNNRIYYADLSDFFYSWMRIPLLRWYDDLPERAYFEPTRTPHAMEGQTNPAEYPDSREEWEKCFLAEGKHLAKIREITGDDGLEEKSPNPLFRAVPAEDMCRQIMTACWAEANRLLKPGGILAFTFHHGEDEAWVDVLKCLLDAGFVLAAAYPVRSDETKGENAAFGSQKIEYDIVHVCRKRLEAPQPVSWARMRRWVKEEAFRLKELLEHSHGKGLPESDTLVILRGKALEFYSRHYGQVFTGDGQVLSVGEALLGINQLLEDLLAGEGGDARQRPPEAAEPASRLFLRIFTSRRSIPRDELHKTLRGTGVAQADLEARGWVKVIGTTVHELPIEERFQYFTAPGRNRRALKADLDQVQFLIGAAMEGSTVIIDRELNGGMWAVKRSVDPILTWYAEMGVSKKIRDAARTAAELVAHWRARPKAKPVEQLSLFERLEAEER